VITDYYRSLVLATALSSKNRTLPDVDSVDTTEFHFFCSRSKYVYTQKCPRANDYYYVLVSRNCGDDHMMMARVTRFDAS
jgi:hypothetical protein